MARFTRIMGWTGLIGLAIGGGSVYLIWQTFRETQRMASDTRDIGERQVRAYISTENTIINDLEVGKIPYITFILKNSGASPARSVSVTTLIGVVPDPEKFKISFGGVRGGSRIEVSANGAYDQVRRFSSTASEQSLAVIQSGLSQVFIGGVISYIDVFGVRRRTVFRSRLPSDNIKGNKGIFVSCQRNNRSS